MVRSACVGAGTGSFLLDGLAPIRFDNSQSTDEGLSPSAIVDSAGDAAAVSRLLSVAFAARASLGACTSQEGMLEQLRGAVGDRTTTLCGYVFKEVGRPQGCGPPMSSYP